MKLKSIVESIVKEYLNEDNEYNISKIRNYLYNYFDLNSVIEPASISIDSDNLRLYHQTSLDNFEQIKRDGKIKLEKSTGKLNLEPTIVWGSIVKNKNDRGFYGSPMKQFTIEYQVPSHEVNRGSGGVSRTIERDEIIAYHDPRLFNIKEIINDDDYLNNIINRLDFFTKFNDSDPTSNEYAYYLIANAIKNY